ncbi:hypothetical protein ACFX13_002279 [Malus domestica]
MVKGYSQTVRNGCKPVFFSKESENNFDRHSSFLTVPVRSSVFRIQADKHQETAFDLQVCNRITELASGLHIWPFHCAH